MLPTVLRTVRPFLTPINVLRKRNTFNSTMLIPPVSSFITKKEKTFQYDELLSNLPIPPLSHTLKMYLQSVYPLVTYEEYQRTEAIVKTFQEGEGRTLHSILMKKFIHSKNWLEKYWLDYAYLSWRDSVVPSMSMAGAPFSYMLMPELKDGMGFKYGSINIYFSMVYWKHLRKEQIAPQKTSRGDYFTMHQQKYLFSSNRLPERNKDIVTTYFKTEAEGDAPSHYLVICLGHIYVLDTLDSNGDIFTPREIQSQLESIWKDAHDKGKAPGIGALTADKRETWLQLRDHLKSLSPANIEHLSEIEEAVGVLALEDLPNVSNEEAVLHALIGNVENRWLEKSNTLLAWPNGQIVSLFDHTNMEGTTGGLFSSFVTCGANEYLQEELNNDIPRRHYPSPRRLDFVVDEKLRLAAQENIEKAKAAQQAIILKLLNITDLGKETLKSWKVNPDSIVQCAIQLAYYKLHGKAAPTYESATTRHFYHGRTETCRTCTKELVRFCEAMVDSKCQKMEKIKHLNNAMQKHGEIMKLCTQNHGCDRHLLGLKLLAQEEGLPTPDIFKDSSWVKSGGDGNFILSTSLNGYTRQSWGTTAMCLDGYGCFYCIADSSIHFHLAAFRESQVTDIQAFIKSLQWALGQIKLLYTSSSKL